MKKNNRKLYDLKARIGQSTILRLTLSLFASTKRSWLLEMLMSLSKSQSEILKIRAALRLSKWKQTKTIYIWWFNIFQEFQFLQLLIVSNQWQLTVYGHNTKNCYENTSGKKKHSGRMDISLAQLEKPVQKLLQTISEIKDNAFIPIAEDDWDFC